MNAVNSNKLASLITQPAPLLGIILLVLAACLVNTYQHVKAPLSEQARSSQNNQAQQIMEGLSSKDIISLDLFGSADAQETSKTSHEDIPETKLKLVLKGAFTNSDPELASALVSKDKNKGAELFIIGDELPGNATLEEVHPNYVVIKRGVQLEKLLFYRNQSETERGSQANTRSTTVYTQPAPVASPKQQEFSPAPTNSTPSTASPKSLSDIREQIRQRHEQ